MDVNKAMDDLAAGKVVGRIVLQIQWRPVQRSTTINPYHIHIASKELINLRIWIRYLYPNSLME